MIKLWMVSCGLALLSLAGCGGPVEIMSTPGDRTEETLRGKCIVDSSGNETGYCALLFAGMCCYNVHAGTNGCVKGRAGNNITTDSCGNTVDSTTCGGGSYLC
jgi:hypothetical protein